VIRLARLLARLVGIALLWLTALAGIAAAIFSIQGAHGTLSLPGLASDIRLPVVRAQVGGFLAHLAAPGSVAIIALLCGVGAILAGLLLLAGTWLSPRPRRIVLERTRAGSLGALRRPLALAAAARAEQPEEVRRARARARARRRGDGGRVRVHARAAMPAGRRQARGSATAAVAALADGLPLRIRVKGHPPRRRERRHPEAFR